MARFNEAEANAPRIGAPVATVPLELPGFNEAEANAPRIAAALCGQNIKGSGSFNEAEANAPRIAYIWSGTDQYVKGLQ